MLATALARAQASGQVHVVIDATGLKVHGAGEWLVEQRAERGKRGWRKLHLAVDPGTGEILASELTSSEEGDASQVGPLLEQIPNLLASVIADGAYNGEPIYRAVSERQPDPPVAVIIPPRSTAVPSANARTSPSQPDQHIQLIRKRGRMGWQKAVSYGRRTLAETAVFRYKIIIGRLLHARSLPAQKTEAKVGCSAAHTATVPSVNQAVTLAQAGIVLPPVRHPAPLPRNVMAAVGLAFERHWISRVRNEAALLRRTIHHHHPTRSVQHALGMRLFQRVASQRLRLPENVRYSIYASKSRHTIRRRRYPSAADPHARNLSYHHA